MDFFDHQEQARKRTSLLLVYFVIAVGLIILSVYAVISAFIVAGGDGPAHLRPVFFEPERFFAVAIGARHALSAERARRWRCRGRAHARRGTGPTEHDRSD
jgi:hypothetical protein